MNDRLGELDIEVLSTSSELLNESVSIHTRNSYSEVINDKQASKKKKGGKHAVSSVRRALEKTIKKRHEKTKKAVMEIDHREESMKCMEGFYEQVEALGRNIHFINSTTTEIGRSHDKLLTGFHSSSEEQKNNNKICALVSKTNMMAKGIQTELKQMKEETETFLKCRKLIHGDIRIRQNLHAVLTKKFLDEIHLYQKAQEEYKVQTRKKFSRQVKYIQPDATEEDIDDLLQNGEDRDTLYQRVVLARGKVNDRIRKVQYDVIEMHKAILTIEQSMAMLHEMFLEMAFLTEEQGIQLDDIYYNTTTAVNYVEGGNEDIKESIQIQKKILKKKRLILLIAGVITVIVIVVVVIIL